MDFDMQQEGFVLHESLKAGVHRALHMASLLEIMFRPLFRDGGFLLFKLISA